LGERWFTIRDGIGSEPIGDITLLRVIIVIGSQVKIQNDQQRRKMVGAYFI